jgi:hypothetical protein
VPTITRFNHLCLINKPTLCIIYHSVVYSIPIIDRWTLYTSLILIFHARDLLFTPADIYEFDMLMLLKTSCDVFRLRPFVVEYRNSQYSHVLRIYVEENSVDKYLWEG